MSDNNNVNNNEYKKYTPIIPIALLAFAAIRATLNQRNEEYETLKLAVKFLVWSQFLQWLAFLISFGAAFHW